MRVKLSDVRELIKRGLVDVGTNIRIIPTQIWRICEIGKEEERYCPKGWFECFHPKIGEWGYPDSNICGFSFDNIYDEKDYKIEIVENERWKRILKLRGDT